jgi:hypothetical protein
MSGQFLIPRSAFVVSRLRNSESLRGMAMARCSLRVSATTLRRRAKISRMSQDAAKTSYRQKEHGVGINIISGDNEMVTRKICKAIENAMLGKDVEALSDASSGVASRGQRA